MSKTLYEQVLGVWELVSFQSADEKGELTYPLGIDPHGYLMYHPDGYVSVQMAKRYRPRYASGDTFIGGTDEEILEAARGFSTYSGRFEVVEKESCLIHYMDISLNPTRIGLNEPRLAWVADDLLCLQSGIKPENKIIWRRLDTNDH